MDKKYHITCLCASCVSVGANAFDPRRWEAHCGAGHTKKWKSTVRVELDDARVFECADADANGNAPKLSRQALGSHQSFSPSVPVGAWLEMRETRGMSAEAIAAAVTRENNESAKTARAFAGASVKEKEDDGTSSEPFAFDAAGWLRTRTVTRTVTREALARDDGAYDDDVREESLAEYAARAMRAWMAQQPENLSFVTPLLRWPTAPLTSGKTWRAIASNAVAVILGMTALTLFLGFTDMGLVAMKTAVAAKFGVGAAAG